THDATSRLGSLLLWRQSLRARWMWVVVQPPRRRISSGRNHEEMREEFRNRAGTATLDAQAMSARDQVRPFVPPRAHSGGKASLVLQRTRAPKTHSVYRRRQTQVPPSPDLWERIFAKWFHLPLWSGPCRDT